MAEQDRFHAVFALAGGPSRSGAQIFLGAERAVRALIRHYRRHAEEDKWTMAFVRYMPDDNSPVALTESVRAVFRKNSSGAVLEAGSRETAEWETRVSQELMELVTARD